MKKKEDSSSDDSAEIDLDKLTEGGSKVEKQNRAFPTKKFIAISVVIVFFIILMGSCGSSLTSESSTGSSKSSSSSTSSTDSSAKSNDFYEGTWLCSGYKKDGDTVSYQNLTTDEKRDFKHIVLQIDENQAYFDSIGSDGMTSSIDSNVFSYEWEKTTTGIILASQISDKKAQSNSVSLQLGENNLLSYAEDGTLYYLEKITQGTEIQVGDMNFGGITFDAPIDLVYTFEATSPSSQYYGIVSSCKHSGPMLSMRTSSTEANDITELSDNYKGYESNFLNHNGVNYFVHTISEVRSTAGEFVANNTLYQLNFNYYEGDPIDYSTYASTFYTTIKINSDAQSSSTQEKQQETPQSSIPEGVISWQEVRSHPGENVSVYGPVNEIYYVPSSACTIIDVSDKSESEKFEGRFLIVIFDQDLNSFPNLDEYMNRNICFSGKLLSNGSGAVATSPSQIQVVD